MLEYVLFGVVHSLSILTDIFVTAYLYKQIKKRRTSLDTIDFGFMVQTLVLGFSGAFVTLYTHTLATYVSETPWIEHQQKFNDLLLALIYTASIAFFNKRVRRKLALMFCCCQGIERQKMQHIGGTLFSTRSSVLFVRGTRASRG
ncbi:hypothetical protein Y032_0144g2452 [Ancylostoma ceylanicum]|uniref:7TM GPCR serpentine receptor class x (Srx) domain-containing protein n=1 Tax=Ancylostoma ceylanicum TaxID=53326 RepID=A0A016T2R5_9BILA|nr:hypothetical protein Y032_0144g2452 [Ancylostoma ceylanicum]